MLARALAAALALFIPLSIAAQTVPPVDPFAILRDGYARGDADLAASAYAEDARFVEDYPGGPPVIRTGRSVIRQGFAALFANLRIGPGRAADLNFRLSADGRTGFYRLRVPDMASGYGRFETVIADGRFTLDRSGPATREDFEDAAGPLRFADADEELDAEYHDRAVGRYLRRPNDRCGILITRSVRRYFMLDECSGAWRGLNRRSGTSWSAGARVIDADGRDPVEFSTDRNSLYRSGRRYERADIVTRSRVGFVSDVHLAGTLYRPRTQTGPLPAAVLIHGSGPQDRNGYASLMALYAEHLARRGFVVLSFDKRGTGDSGGDWAGAGFGHLAADVNAARAFLRAQPGVDPDRIGLMGSSQAGWVAAQAIRDGGDPAFVILIGAAGAALTVEEQNLYNTEVRMRCAGIAEPDISLALDQQRAFFAAKRDPARAADLAASTARAAARPSIADWLFPGTIEAGAVSEWYDVLDPAFDPLPVWRGYRGRSYFLFGGLDDSTPSALAAERLRTATAATVTFLPSAQHIGLAARGLCTGELDAVSAFHPGFFVALDRALGQIARRRRR